MKLKNILLSVGLLAILVGCERKYDQPLLVEPEATGIEANITISELKAKYSQAKQNNPLLIDTDYILRAVVGGNDESGNIYKTLYVQDKTGGIPIAVDQNAMFSEYQVGQELFIKLKGLSINVYGGVQQIGYVEKEDPKKTRIAPELLKTITTRHKYPDPEKVAPIQTTIGGLNDSMIGMVVELNDVSWKEVGQVFAIKEENTNRTLYDGKNQTLLVRNSGYSNFAADLIPEGVGTVRGVLSKFNTEYQLFLRTKADVLHFRPGKPSGDGSTGGSDDKPSKPDTPAASDKQSATASLLFAGADFEDEAAFNTATGQYGLKFCEVKAGVGFDGSKGLHISGTPDKNPYFFSAKNVMIPADKEKGVKTISFYLKGKVTGKSLSINVYHPDGKYVAFNLGDVTTSKQVEKTKSTREEQFVNQYNGTIDTGGKWVLITLNVEGVDLNTAEDKNIIGFKGGKEAEYDLYIDSIKFE